MLACASLAYLTFLTVWGHKMKEQTFILQKCILPISKVGFFGPEQSHLTCVRPNLQVCHYPPRGKILHFHTCSFAHAGFQLMYANITGKWGFSLTETRVWGSSVRLCSRRRKCGMGCSNPMLDTFLGCSTQPLQLLMTNGYSWGVIRVLVCSITTWKNLLRQRISLLKLPQVTIFCGVG